MRFKILLFISFFTVIFVSLLFVHFELNSRAPPTADRRTPKKPRKLILVWSKSLSKNPIVGFPIGVDAFAAANCPVDACETTTTRSRFSEADTVVFFSRDLYYYRSKNPESLVRGYDMPQSHPAHQRWVYYMQESPVHTFLNLGPFRDVFNWTMTYRRDSDIPVPFGRFRERNCVANGTCPSEGTRDYARNKTGLVAWFVSNCKTNSRRENFVDDLKKYVDVHIYGACAKRKCPKVIFSGSAPCYEMLKSYKFYLSLDNSICRDYMTEKTWTILSNTTAVPLVRSGGFDEALLPPGAVIDANNLTPKELAETLKQIDADDARYNAFHDWRRRYEVFGVHSRNVARAWCDLCAALHDDTLPRKSYRDLRQFWSKEKDCLIKVDPQLT